MHLVRESISKRIEASFQMARRASMKKHLQQILHPPLRNTFSAVFLIVGVARVGVGYSWEFRSNSGPCLISDL